MINNAAGLAIAKKHCRVDSDDEDELLELYIMAALNKVESYTGRAISERDKTFFFSNFGDCLEFPVSPVSAIVTIIYTDPDGDVQTLDAADFRLIAERVYPQAGQTFPDIQYPSEIAVTATIGDAEAEGVEAMEQAQLLLIGHYYENREAVVVGSTPNTVPMAVKHLLDDFRDELA